MGEMEQKPKVSSEGQKKKSKKGTGEGNFNA